MTVTTTYTENLTVPAEGERRTQDSIAVVAQARYSNSGGGTHHFSLARGDVGDGAMRGASPGRIWRTCSASNELAISNGLRSSTCFARVLSQSSSVTKYLNQGRRLA